jgi:hypothetical protein
MTIFFKYLDDEKQIVFLVGAVKFRTATIGMHVVNQLQQLVSNSDSHSVTTKEQCSLNLQSRLR